MALTDLIHIYNLPRTACAGCGTTYSASLAFVDSIGYWNTLADRCIPEQVLKPDYVLVTRLPDRDNQTAALKEDHTVEKRRNQKEHNPR